MKASFIAKVFLLSVCKRLVFCSPDNATERWEMMLLADYLAYQGFRYLQVVKAVSPKRKTSNDGYWVDWTFTRIIKGGHTFASVTRICSTPKSKSFIQKTSEEPPLNDCRKSLNHNILQTSMNNAPKIHKTLVVFRLYNEDDAFGLKEILTNTDDISWLLLTDASFPKLLRHVYMPLDNQVTIAAITPEEGFAHFWQVYHVSPYVKQKMEMMGHWTHMDYAPNAQTNLYDEQASENTTSKHTLNSPGTRTQVSKVTEFQKMTYGYMNLSKDDFALRRLDLTGLHLRCTTRSNPPFLKLVKDGSTVGISGVFALIFHQLQKLTNFTYNCHNVKDNSYGEELHGRWTGLVGELLYGDADIAVTTLSITPKRSVAIDYLVGVSEDRFVVFMKRPKESDGNWEAYTKVFPQEVWLIIVLFLLTFVVFTYACFCFHCPQSSLSISEVALTIVGFFLGQCTPLQPSQGSLRIIFLTVLTFQVLILTHYTSHLVSQVASGSPPPKISSLQDVAKDPQARIVYSKGTAMHEYLRDSSVNEIRQLWLRNRDENFAALTRSMSESTMKVLHGKGKYFAIMAEKSYLFSNGKDCQTYRLPHTYFPGLYSFGIPKGSPIKPVFNQLILKMQSSGILDKWMNDVLPEVDDCNIRGTSPVELRAASIPFLLLLGAMVFSAMVLGVELCLKRKSLKYSRNKRQMIYS